jgi:TolA-binding protein
VKRVRSAGFVPARALAFAAAAACPAGPREANAAPAPRKETVPRMTIDRTLMGEGTPSDDDSSSVPRTYEALIRRFSRLAPSDSMGNGDYRAAQALFAAGKFDEAVSGFRGFTARYPRNLNVNDALSSVLLIQEARDFEDRPLHLYARALSHREAGRADSARTLLAEAAERFPGAKARHRIQYALAELALERADHAGALRWALAAADTTGGNRTAPFALRIAAESSLALGKPPQEALAYYKIILERYPQSAVTPAARVRALEIRKAMPQ